MKTYTKSELRKKFEFLSKNEQINTLWSALDIMQQHNGRDRWGCIFMAMGYESEYDICEIWTKSKEL